MPQIESRGIGRGMEPYYQGGSSVAEHMMNEDGSYLPRFDVRDG